MAPNNIKAVAINSKNVITGKAENKIDYFFAENVPIETNYEILKDSRKTYITKFTKKIFFQQSL